MIIRIYSKLMINYAAKASASWRTMMRVLPDMVFRNYGFKQTTHTTAIAYNENIQRTCVVLDWIQRALWKSVCFDV